MLWYEKYRPTSLDEFVWTDSSIREKVESWIEKPERLPHLILEGHSGTGKTSLAYLLRDTMQIEPSDWFYRNASKSSGIDVVREEIIEFCESGGWSGVKVVLLDEAERLTKDAQQTLRGVIDDYGDTVRFIFTCNNVGRIIDALKSRCRVVSFQALPEGQFTDRLLDICMQEQIDLEDEKPQEVFQQIIERTYPDLRAAIGELEYRCTNGVLQNDVPDAGSEHQSVVLDYLNAKKDLGELRQEIVALKGSAIEDIFVYLYENSSDIFERYEDEAIIVIADHLYRHSTVSFPQINLCSALVKLRRIKEDQ